MFLWQFVNNFQAILCAHYFCTLLKAQLIKGDAEAIFRELKTYDYNL